MVCHLRQPLARLKTSFFKFRKEFVVLSRFSSQHPGSCTFSFSGELSVTLQAWKGVRPSAGGGSSSVFGSGQPGRGQGSLPLFPVLGLPANFLAASQVVFYPAFNSVPHIYQCFVKKARKIQVTQSHIDSFHIFQVAGHFSRNFWVCRGVQRFVTKNAPAVSPEMLAQSVLKVRMAPSPLPLQDNGVPIILPH